jgi:hypothetical protein
MSFLQFKLVKCLRNAQEGKIGKDQMKIALTIYLLSISFSQGFAQPPDTKDQKIYSDTVSLLMPKPAREDTATAKDYEHCLDITRTDYKAILNGKEYILGTKAELFTFLKERGIEVKARKVSIIWNAQTGGKLWDMLEMLEQQGIVNYKVVLGGKEHPQPVPTVLQGIKPFLKNIDMNDSTVLIILSLDDSLRVSLLNKTNTFRKVMDLDLFLKENERRIDPNKIVVQAVKNAGYDEISPIVKMLTRHHYNGYFLKAIE